MYITKGYIRGIKKEIKKYYRIKKTRKNYEYAEVQTNCASYDNRCIGVIVIEVGASLGNVWNDIS